MSWPPIGWSSSPISSMRSRSFPRRRTSWSRMTSAMASSAPQRRATRRIARSEYPDSAACTAGSAKVRGPIFSNRGLLRLRVEAEQVVLVADIELPAEDHGMGPGVLPGGVGHAEAARLLVARGRGLDERDLA